jgi:glutamate/aspartate transport system substrate-binding protein
MAPDGQPIGYAIDICARFVERLRTALALPKLRVEYRMITPANRVELVAKGEVQIECGSTTNTAARREQVSFTIPHFITGARLLVRADSPIQRSDDVALKRAVSTIKSTPLGALRRLKSERLPRLEILEAEDLERAVRMVEKGEADAFAMDDVLLFGIAANRADPKSLRITGRFLTTEPLAIMLPKSDPAFKRIIDGEMRRLILDGEIHPIYAKWFEQPIPPRNVALGLPVSYLLRDFWRFPSDQVP